MTFIQETRQYLQSLLETQQEQVYGRVLEAVSPLAKKLLSKERQLVKTGLGFFV